MSNVSMKVANETLACSKPIIYYPDPKFTSFTSTKTGQNIRITIQVIHIFPHTCTYSRPQCIKGEHLPLLSFQKKADKLEMSTAELSVFGIREEKYHKCIMVSKTYSDETEFFICEIKTTTKSNFQELKVNLSVILQQA